MSTVPALAPPPGAFWSVPESGDEHGRAGVRLRALLLASPRLDAPAPDPLPPSMFAEDSGLGIALCAYSDGTGLLWRGGRAAPWVLSGLTATRGDAMHALLLDVHAAAPAWNGAVARRQEDLAQGAMAAPWAALDPPPWPSLSDALDGLALIMSMILEPATANASEAECTLQSSVTLHGGGWSLPTLRLAGPLVHAAADARNPYVVDRWLGRVAQALPDLLAELGNPHALRGQRVVHPNPHIPPRPPAFCSDRYANQAQLSWTNFNLEPLVLARLRLGSHHAAAASAHRKTRARALARRFELALPNVA